jgi:serine/threonine protein kinase
VAIKKIFSNKIANLEKWLLEIEFLRYIHNFLHCYMFSILLLTFFLDAGSTLRHPNVVVFYGACTTPPDLAIVTEWVARGSLRAVLEDESIRTSPQTHTHTHLRMTVVRRLISSGVERLRLLSFATDTARGLHFLHSHDPPIIHRGITPAAYFQFPFTLRTGCHQNAKVV